MTPEDIEADKPRLLDLERKIDAELAKGTDDLDDEQLATIARIKEIGHEIMKVMDFVAADLESEDE